ncbi:MAG TPA: hypothetical protein VI757_16265 [Bacteroidia bacterium]|nr:hypothetical protein [Bacteroidia bacterium]
MKTKISLLFIGLLAVVTAAVIGISSCSKEDASPTGSDSPGMKYVDVNFQGSGQNCVQLTAGQTINVGSVCFDDVNTDNVSGDDALQVCYTTTGCWKIDEIHFWIGTSLTTMPQTRTGNPIPGQFPYAYSFSGGVTTYCFTIPFSVLGWSCPNTVSGKYLIAAHAAVRDTCTNQTQTGWGAGERIVTKGNWATYFSIYITCDDAPPPPDDCGCETAFGKSSAASTCFDQISCTGNTPRWGWSNGPYTCGTTDVLTLKAGAGGGGTCGTGTDVGTVTVNYNCNGDVTVTYNMSTTPVGTCAAPSLDEVHIYVGTTQTAMTTQGCGTEASPCCTISPGQFGWTVDLSNATTYSHTFSGNSGSIYVVAHAVVCGLPD